MVLTLSLQHPVAKSFPSHLNKDNYIQYKNILKIISITDFDIKVVIQMQDMIILPKEQVRRLILVLYSSIPISMVLQQGSILMQASKFLLIGLTSMQHLTSVHLEEMEQTTGKPDRSGFLYQEDLGQAERSAKRTSNTCVGNQNCCQQS